MKYWLVVGSPQNWITAFDHGNIWGLKLTQQRLWDNLREGEPVLFYATSPVSGIIGWGHVRTKFRQDKPLWPQESNESRVIWPLRFEFDIQYCVPGDRWETDRIASDVLQPRGGFQLLAQSTGEQLVALLEQRVRKGAGVIANGGKPLAVTSPGEPISHDSVRDALIQIGKLQGFIAESEYPFDIGRLDVVWRRVQKSVPTYVFEVQIGGNLHQAMSKLKHAFDLWNSHVFLACTEGDSAKAAQLLSGTFHEVGDRLKVLQCSEVVELLKRKRSYREFERELGIL